jgi:tRNA modification GTPase
MIHEDTIFALSSGAGMTGVAVIRVSGLCAGTSIEHLAGPLPAARRATLRTLRRSSPEAILDQGLVLWMPGPASATGEDMAEFHVHGSPAVIQSMCVALLALPGMRLAEPGEFSRRAFSNGKLDLVEVEGLADLLQARTEVQRRLAVAHLTGQASTVYDGWRGDILEILSYLEAAIDFAEEEDVAAEALSRSRPMALQLIANMSAALADAERAGRVRQGIRVVLAGAPNAGKSSLLNSLAGRQAAIVSPHPGTTRDVIDVPVILAGVPVILTDTAGLREATDDAIERVGMDRAVQVVRDADLLVWLVAPDIPPDTNPPVQPALWVRTKSDLPGPLSIRQRNENELSVSAMTGAGMAELVTALEGLVAQACGATEHAVVVRVRHKTAVAESIRMLNDFLAVGPSQMELAAEALRQAAITIGRITGRIDVEDVLDNIFREFCIGK